MRGAAATALLSLVLAGCQAPGLAPAGVAVAARLAIRYDVQALMSAYGPASIDHVRLTLLSAPAGSSSYKATGAAPVRIAASALSQPIALGELRIDTAYEVLADAFASSNESLSPISDPSRSTTTFTTPALGANGQGVPTINDTPQALVALNLRLADQTYPGTATLNVVPSSIKSDFASIQVTLYQVTSTGQLVQRYQRMMPVSQATQPLSVTNLRMATNYTTLALGYHADGTLASKGTDSYTRFTTPVLSNGQVETNAGRYALSVTP